MPSTAPWLPWMQRALQLAELGAGRTSPNPLVGAVVLDAGGSLVGRATTPGPANPTPRWAPWPRRASEPAAAPWW